MRLLIYIVVCATILLVILAVLYANTKPATLRKLTRDVESLREHRIEDVKLIQAVRRNANDQMNIEPTPLATILLDELAKHERATSNLRAARNELEEL